MAVEYKSAAEEIEAMLNGRHESEETEDDTTNSGSEIEEDFEGDDTNQDGLDAEDSNDEGNDDAEDTDGQDEEEESEEEDLETKDQDDGSDADTKDEDEDTKKEIRIQTNDLTKLQKAKLRSIYEESSTNGEAAQILRFKDAGIQCSNAVEGFKQVNKDNFKDVVKAFTDA